MIRIPTSGLLFTTGRLSFLQEANQLKAKHASGTRASSARAPEVKTDPWTCKVFRECLFGLCGGGGIFGGEPSVHIVYMEMACPPTNVEDAPQEHSWSSRLASVQKAALSLSLSLKHTLTLPARTPTACMPFKNLLQTLEDASHPDSPIILWHWSCEQLPGQLPHIAGFSHAFIPHHMTASQVKKEALSFRCAQACCRKWKLVHVTPSGASEREETFIFKHG